VFGKIVAAVAQRGVGLMPEGERHGADARWAQLRAKRNVKGVSAAAGWFSPSLSLISLFHERSAPISSSASSVVHLRVPKAFADHDGLIACWQAMQLQHALGVAILLTIENGQRRAFVEVRRRAERQATYSTHVLLSPHVCTRPALAADTRRAEVNSRASGSRRVDRPLSELSTTSKPTSQASSPTKPVLEPVPRRARAVGRCAAFAQNAAVADE
jgi:hypothetical protein